MSHLGIITAWNYAWSVLGACFVIGIAIYLLDRKFGIHIYRFGYDFFHRNPMPKEVERGFLYRQSSNRGVSIALILSSIYSLYMSWELGFSMDFIAELIVWLLMSPALVLGFWAGRWIHKVLLRRSAYLDKLDELGERVENMDVGRVTKILKTHGASIASRVGRIYPPQQAATKPAPEPIAPPPEELRPDFREMLKKYTNREE